MREWKNREQLLAQPIQTRSQRIRVAGNNVPLQLRPGNTVHRESLIIEMQTRRGGIQRNLTSSGAILQAAEAICPRIQEWNAGSAAFDAGRIEIVDAAQKLNPTQAKRSAEHSSRGPERCLHVTDSKNMRGRAAHIRPRPRGCERIVGHLLGSYRSLAPSIYYSQLSVHMFMHEPWVVQDRVQLLTGHGVPSPIRNKHNQG